MDSVASSHRTIPSVMHTLISNAYTNLLAVAVESDYERPEIAHLRRTIRTKQSMSTPGLLSLPPELRRWVFDLLLSPLKEKPRYDGIYVLPHETPVHDFSTYRALALTCGQMHDEVERYFEDFILSHLTVYFVDDVPALYDCAARLEHANERIKRRMQFSLSTRCGLSSLHYSRERLYSTTAAFMKQHASFPTGPLRLSIMPSPPHHVVTKMTETWGIRADGALRQKLLRGKVPITCYYHPPHEGLIQVVARKIEGRDNTNYKEMTGKFCDLNWLSYDAEAVETLWRDDAARGVESLMRTHRLADKMHQLISMLSEDAD